MGAGTHTVSQGVLSVMQGGSFEQAFWSGALGSLGASGWRAVMGTSGGAMVVFGAISGGIGAELSGGNFWQGAVIGGTVAWLNHAMHRENDDEWMLTKDGRIIKVGNRGGNKTDYLYDEFTYAQTIESRTLLATADVQHSTATTGYFSSGGCPVQEGFGYRVHTQFGGHALTDPSFDIASSLLDGGGAFKTTTYGGRHLLAKNYNRILKLHPRLTKPSTLGYGYGQFDVAHRASAFFQKEIFLKGSFGVKNYKTIYFNHNVGNRTFSIGINPWKRTIFHQGPGKFK